MTIAANSYYAGNISDYGAINFDEGWSLVGITGYNTTSFNAILETVLFYASTKLIYVAIRNIGSSAVTLTTDAVVRTLYAKTIDTLDT